jgi:hypothetical protein
MHFESHRRPAPTLLLIILSMALSIALTTGCSSIKIANDYDPAADFAPYHTFTWLEMPAENQTQARDPLLHNRIMAAVETQLGERGYARSDAGGSDFLVGYHLRVEDKLDVQTINRSYGYGYGRYGRYGGWGYPAGGYSETRVTEYEEGTFIIDIVDGASNELVWRGTARGRLRDRKTPEERDKAVRETVAAVLKKFPPEPK